jgi:hypothetical protein
VFGFYKTATLAGVTILAFTVTGIHAQTTGSAGATARSSALPAGNVIASDNMTDPSQGLLPTSAQFPDRCSMGYENGVYKLDKTDTADTTCSAVVKGGNYSDVIIVLDESVDFTSATTPGQTLNLNCRNNSEQQDNYGFVYHPVTMQMWLQRKDAGVITAISPRVGAPVTPINGATHQIIFGCAGARIFASIDGNTVADVQDATYTTGKININAGGDRGAQSQVLATIHNLTLLQPTP